MFYKSMYFKLAFFSLLTLLISGVKAQTEQLDSLRNLVYAYPKEDTTKVRLLYEYHFAYDTKVNYDSMNAIQLKVERLALNLGDSLSIAKSLILKGRLFNKKGNFNREIDLLKSAISKIETIEEKKIKYYIYSSIGVDYYRLNFVNKELDSCLFFYNKSILYTEKESQKAKCYQRLSQAYSTLGNVEESLKYNIKILEIAESNNEPEFYLAYYNAQKYLYEALNNKDSAILYSKMGFSKYLESKDNTTKFKKGLIHQYRSVGGTFYNFKEFDSSIVYYEPCIDLARDISDVDSYKSALSMLSYLYSNKNEFEKGLELSNAAIKYGHEIGDTALISRSMFSITYIYDGLKDYEKGIKINNDLIENYLQALPPYFEGQIYGNQSYFYFENKDYKNAVKFGLRAYNYNPSKTTTLYNLADAYLEAYKDSSISIIEILPTNLDNESVNSSLTQNEARQKVLVLIKGYYEKALAILNKANDKINLVHPHYGLGQYYDIVGDEKNVIFHYGEAWKYSKGDGVPLKDQLRISNRLYELYKKKKNTLKTLEWLEVRDSLEKVQLSQNDLAELGKKQAEFEYSQKIYADSLDQKQKDLAVKYEQEKQALKLKAEEEKKYYLYGGLFLLAIFLFVLFRRFKIALKQKSLIELQKESIEEKRLQLRKTHEGIQDSINYSKRIQKAVFPSKESVKSLFPNSFLFFKPKDIVSGDFYWVYESKGKKIIVTADCTGHGVPGAFMTIIGINILKEIVQEGIIDAEVILKEINKRLIKGLSQHGESSVKDGMDLALCVIDSNTIEFVGAHLPLYHVRDGELIEYKGSNIFLGSKFEMIEPKVHYIPYQKGDVIYMSTDGLPDQKGGEKGKKFYSKRLKEFLLSNSALSMIEQETKLADLRIDWLDKKYEQLDDITVVGIQL